MNWICYKNTTVILRSNLRSKGADGSEDATAANAINEVLSNFMKEIPSHWAEPGVDEELINTHTDADTQLGATQLLALSMCGSKIGSVYVGLDNFSIPTLRLQAGHGRAVQGFESLVIGQWSYSASGEGIKADHCSQLPGLCETLANGFAGGHQRALPVFVSQFAAETRWQLGAHLFCVGVVMHLLALFAVS